MKIDPNWAPIPGETPIDDVSGLLLPDIGTRRQLNQVEAENIAVAAAKYLVGRLSEEEAPFTFDWFFELHREMFGRVWGWAGKPRNHNLNLGCKFYDVEANVLDLVRTIPYWGKGNAQQLLKDAALLHYRSVTIHPFINGNGRWARLLANIWLRKQKQKPVMWPEPEIGHLSPIRNEYLEAIRLADMGNLGPFTDLHLRYAFGS
ncbi:MAG: mobile mystery protein B [Gemmataceae bacterium]